MDSLRKRRCVGLLVFLKKLFTGAVDCGELLARLNFLVPRLSSCGQALFSPHFAHLLLGANSPINNMMRLHNALPQHIDVLSSTLTSFKHQLFTVLG
ncbi:hypothetical protein J6590_033181 [Homalodisca vitripennis]|nr:hypothetical protein J6590_033181 [Homalodisca vitripennis]